MLLIDTLVASHDGGGVAQSILPKDCIVADVSGRIDPIAFIELMAQTYAAVKGWEITQAGKEFPIGYLVGVQKFESLSPCFTDEMLTIEVATVGEFEGFAVVEGIVRRNETVLAQGKIKLWVPEDGA